MYIKMIVPACDFEDKKLQPPVPGVGCLARGLTGRWSVVMYMGPDYARRMQISAMSRNEAIQKIEALGDTYDF
jgi:hypothetical protein